MKRILSLLVAILGVAIIFAAPAKSSVVTDGIASIHDDVTSSVSTVYQDGKDLVAVIYGDSKDLLKNVYPEVKEAVQAIANAVGVAAEHLYIVLVKKYLVEGITEFVFFLLAFILIGIGWYETDQYVNKRPLLTNADGSTQMAPITWRIFYPLGILIAGIIVAIRVDYSEMFINLINPEWGAINYILETTKALVK